jgi:hypothetical protein
MMIFVKMKRIKGGSMKRVYNLQKMGSGKGVYLNKTYKEWLGLKEDKVIISFDGNKMIIEAYEKRNKKREF